MKWEDVEGAIEYTVECLPEHTPIQGNAMASGDDELDHKVERDILADLQAGNPWAWCCVKVTAAFRGLEETDYLGCCSYESEEGFREPGGYFDDMKATARDRLLKTLTDLQVDHTAEEVVEAIEHFLFPIVGQRGEEFTLLELVQELDRKRTEAITTANELSAKLTPLQAAAQGFVETANTVKALRGTLGEATPAELVAVIREHADALGSVLAKTREG
jgi:hypothetical protein